MLNFRSPRWSSPEPPGLRYCPLVAVLAAFVAGIFVDRHFAAPVAVWSLLAVGSLVVWLICWRGDAWRQRWAIVPLLLALAACGGARHYLAWRLYPNDEIGLASDEQPRPICLECVAVTGPRHMPAPPYDPLRSIPTRPKARLRVRVTAVRDGTTWRAASGLAMLYIPLDSTDDAPTSSDAVDNSSADAAAAKPASAMTALPDLHAGDKLRIFARLAAPAGPQNPGEFDFAQSARADRQWALLSLKSIHGLQVIEHGSWFSPRRWLEAARTAGIELLWQKLSAREAALASAVLLGAREQVDNERTEALLTTGTIHILSIAGMHLGILAWVLFSALRVGCLPRWLTATLVAAVTVAYTLLTDAEPHTVRAMIMVLVVCGAVCLGRRRLAFNSLACAALVVLAINPNDLFRVGTQMSFLSVSCLAWLAQRLDRRAIEDPLQRLIRLTRPWHVQIWRQFCQRAWEVALVSLLFTLVTQPLVAARFHVISPVAIVMNALLTIPMTMALSSGFIVLCVGSWLPGASGFFGRVCDLNLHMLDDGIAWSERLPGGHFWSPGPPDWWLWGFYAGLAALALLPGLTWRGRPVQLPIRWRWAIAALWLTVGLAAPLVRTTRAPRLECCFVSVGHGLAVAVHLPDGRTMLYDAGRMGSPAGGMQSVAAYLWSRGISHIDAIVLSHADTDHYNAVPQLLKRFSVGAVYTSPIMFRDQTEALAVLHDAVDTAGVPLRKISSGDRLATGAGCRIEVWHPPAAGVVGRDLDRHNANCIVLSIEYSGRRVLLAGDLEGTGLRNLLAELPCHCDVLLAPHHGSARSDPAGLAQWSRPNLVVVSNAPTFLTGAATKHYESVGATVLNTADRGAISVTIDAAGLRTETFRSPRRK